MLNKILLLIFLLSGRLIELEMYFFQWDFK